MTQVGVHACVGWGTDCLGEVGFYTAKQEHLKYSRPSWAPQRGGVLTTQILGFCAAITQQSGRMTEHLGSTPLLCFTLNLHLSGPQLLQV